MRRRVGAEEVRHASRNADSACPFCHRTNTKRGTLSQHFVTHVVPPLGWVGGGGGGEVLWCCHSMWAW